jgi:hypothetical protein
MTDSATRYSILENKITIITKGKSAYEKFILYIHLFFR